MRILILEDDPLIGLDLQDIVEGCGDHVVKLCGSLAELRACLRGESADFAFLDVDLPDGKSYGVASQLADHRIPFAFVSASRRTDVPEHLRGARFIAKPYPSAAIRTMLAGESRIAC